MLACDALTFQIKDKNLVNNVSLKFQPGQFYSILGPNGAGKSTLLKLLTQEMTPTSGHIEWLQDPISTYSGKYWSQQRGILNQWNTVSMGFTNEEIVMMGRYPYYKNVPSAEDSQIVNDKMTLTETQQFAKIEYDILSGGEKQRIHLARVLSQVTKDADEPLLLILDEPLNNLDIKHQHNILQLARDFSRQGHIVIAVLHDLNLASAYSDEVILMQKGRVVANGKAQEVYDEEILQNCYDVSLNVHLHPERNIPIVHINPTIYEHESKNIKKEQLWK